METDDFMESLREEEEDKEWRKDHPGEEIEPIIEQVEGATQSTDHDHYYTEGVVINGLKEAICSCGHGLSISPEVKIVKGKICWNQS